MGGRQQRAGGDHQRRDGAVVQLARGSIERLGFGEREEAVLPPAAMDVEEGTDR